MVRCVWRITVSRARHQGTAHAQQGTQLPSPWPAWAGATAGREVRAGWAQSGWCAATEAPSSSTLSQTMTAHQLPRPPRHQQVSKAHTCTCIATLTFTLLTESLGLENLNLHIRDLPGAGFKSVSIASGWAIDNLFNLPGGNPSNSNFSCPDGTLISGFAAAAVSYPLGWIVDLRLRCSGECTARVWLPCMARTPVFCPLCAFCTHQAWPVAAMRVYSPNQLNPATLPPVVSLLSSLGVPHASAQHPPSPSPARHARPSTRPHQYPTQVQLQRQRPPQRALRQSTA